MNYFDKMTENKNEKETEEHQLVAGFTVCRLRLVPGFKSMI